MSRITYTAKRRIANDNADYTLLFRDAGLGDGSAEILVHRGTGAVTFTRSGVATTVDASGKIVSVAANVPRYAYDPLTLEPKGMLIEEGRTNLFLRSEEFDNAAWAKSNASVSANAIAAPSGAVTADKLIEDTATSTHALFQSVNVNTGSTYIVSVFAKANERSHIAIQLPGTQFGGGSAPFAVFNVGDGTILSQSGLEDAGIENYGNGWYRCWVKDTASATASASLQLYMHNGSTFSYVGDGTSGMYVWGAQAESGLLQTSYIPTTTAAVARGADVPTVSDISGFFNALEGTIVAEWLSASSRSGYQSTFSCNNGSVGSQISTYTYTGSTNIQFVVLVGGGTQVLIRSGVISNNTIQRHAVAYKTNDYVLVLNGSLLGVDNSGALPTVDRLNLGHRLESIHLNGHLRRFDYYASRLPNATLEAMSALSPDYVRTLGESYDIDFDAEQLDDSFTPDGHEHQPKGGGQAHVILNRIDRTIEVAPTIRTQAEALQWREFLCSHMGGEPFTLDPMGTAAAPVEPLTCQLKLKGFSASRLPGSFHRGFRFTALVLD